MRYPYALFTLLLAVTAQAQTTHIVEVEDNEFDPASLTIELGDDVLILWDDDVAMPHNFLEVDAATWIANGTTPLAGGYALGDGTDTPGHVHTITPTANVWYVCEYHASMGMKGTITVVGASAIADATAQHAYRFAPNPATDRTALIAPDGRAVQVQLTDATGRHCLRTTLAAGDGLALEGLTPGAYVAELRSTEGDLLSRQRLVIAR
jgi:plastocyanin